ncbi:PREDICTED: uncharacterized protein LOC109128817 [Camelina sativa]|uniref:Uncharacterized protein LOC109128817 n=1 Tax=Camelina sativa TaxID=90675 RepID=A0ABM1QXD3_CAMSA|nr:PREDICTED: uncharacterized protein LOC109128817 [Camelina sativa]
MMAKHYGIYERVRVLCAQWISSTPSATMELGTTGGVWRNLAQPLLATNYSADWNQLIALLTSPALPHFHLFMFRYLFQSTLYHLWRERNARRHGEPSNPQALLIKHIDKNIRNRLSSIASMGYQRYADGLQLWFSTHPPP